MINKSRKSIGMIMIMVFFISIISCDNDAITFNLEVVETQNNIWRIVDSQGNNRGTLEVIPNDVVNWTASGSDLEFRFQTDIRNYFEYENNHFNDGRTQTLNDGDTLSLTIRDNAPKDTLVYQVYVAIADTFVVGNSPPVMIITERR